MCGISGIINFNNQPAEESLIRKMMQAMKHRGPDDEGIFIHENTGLGFVRLSIIDLSIDGHQPMVSDDQRYVMVFNGEIFNYIELKSELEQKGYTFRTKTDTEVLLTAYIEWGEDCLHKLNGMWAFAIYDRDTKKAFISRDRFGVKPFYYHFDDERFIFASEVTPILQVLTNQPSPNDEAIYDYLVYNRTDQTENTFFQGIKKLQHGHSMTIADGQVQIKRWYDLKQNLKKPFSSSSEYAEMLSSSVSLRLRSDVPVGVCLSGGLDSSAIVSLLLKKNNLGAVNTFSAVYNKGDKGDESDFIDLYKDQVKNMHFIFPTGESLLSDIKRFVTAHAEPIPSTSPYAQFKVMELAKGKVVVTLDGQGADEQLAGYHYFFGVFFKDLFLKLKWFSLIKEIFYYITRHKSILGLQTFIFYMLPSGLRKNNRIKSRGYINTEFLKKFKNNTVISDGLYNANNLNEALLNHFEFKLEHLLKWEDRNSMHFSIEARTPFLDYRLVERTLSLPSDQLIKHGVTKHILREAMKGVLPEAIRLRQDKIGFSTPEAKWFRNQEFYNLIKDVFSSDSFRSRGYIDHIMALDLLEKHINGKGDYSREIWKMLHLELWFREFIDQSKTEN
ncbi:MAG: asparagine synthase (glutamine-hydrolyzing) [Bacteroidota bacterium]